MRESFDSLKARKAKNATRGARLAQRRPVEPVAPDAAPAGNGKAKRRGRPPAKLSPRGRISNITALERLGLIQATLDEAAVFFSVSQPTISKRLRDHPELKVAWDRGQALGRMSIRRLLYARALEPTAGGARAALFLARQLLWDSKPLDDEQLADGTAEANADAALDVLSAEDRALFERLMAKATGAEPTSGSPPSGVGANQ